MSDLMQHLNFVRTYLGDLLVISYSNFEDHLTKMECDLKTLSDKSTFCADEIEYLGYWVSRSGIQPIPKKVEAIKNMVCPTTRTELRRFIGMENYYRDMWVLRSELLAPLTSMTSKKIKFNWTGEHQKVFENIKKIICREVMLTFPDFSKPFHIYTYASDKQLGPVITQDEKPVAFYSRKLNSAQQRYTTGEQELLSIVETLREFRNILLGYKIMVHTDHKKITYAKSNSDRVMRWHLLIEEFGPSFRNIKGKHNLIADATSRLAFDDSSEESKLEKPTALCMAATISRTDIINDELSPTYGFEMAEAFGIKSKKKTKNEDYKFHM
jgi:hypothetical protein